MAVLESELGAKIQLIDYQPPRPESPGADATAVIAHGELDVLDFCLPIARTLRRYGLTPVILGDGVESGELQEGQRSRRSSARALVSTVLTRMPRRIHLWRWGSRSARTGPAC